MATEYTPELGQALFGQPYKQLAVPIDLEVALDAINSTVDCFVEYNPFGNTGERLRWSCFQVHAYNWGDEEQQWNFKWRDLEVSWYKYVGRGMSRNRKVSKSEIKEMLRECLTAVLTEEAIHDD